MGKDDGPAVDADVAKLKAFPFHAKTIEECFAALGESADLGRKGLSAEQRQQRLDKYGPNKLTEKKKVTLCERIWHQIANVLVFILIIIAVVSLASIALAPSQQYEIASGIQFGLIVFVIT